MPRLTRSTLLTVLLIAAVAGCSRQQFRERADRDVQGVITQKNIFPDWQVENWHVYPDPRSRFADRSNPDFPPYPPDDYAAYILSPNPQKPGRGGSGREDGTGYLDIITAWDAQNRAEDEAAAAEEKRLEKEGRGTPGSTSSVDLDKPGNYQENDPANPNRGEEFSAIAGGAAGYLRTFQSDAHRFRLRLNQAVELGLFNAREFQDRREDLYLAALPVTLERFNFAAQAFATEQIIREVTGSQRTEGAGNRWRINTTPTVTKTFATGAELMVRLANQVVIDLSNGRPDVSISNFSLTFVQPLLQGGGYAVTLEPLTLAERTLLYAIRSYARFRRVFYYAIAGGGGYTNNPYGLQGLSANLGRGVGANLTANAIGYLPTILRAAILENQRKNVATLEQFLRLFQNLKEGGGVTELQAMQVEQQLIQSRFTVLTNTQQYLDGLDNFKLQLGVPTTLPIELDNRPLLPIRKQLNRFELVYNQLGDLERLASKYDPNEPADRYRQRWANLFTQSALVRGTPFAANYPRTAAELQKLTNEDVTKRLKDAGDQRRKLLDAQTERQLKNQPDTAAQLAEIAALEAVIDRLLFEQALRKYESRSWQKLSNKERQITEQALEFRSVLETGMLVAVQPRNDRLLAIRQTWPALPPIVVDGEDVIRLPLDQSYVKIGQAALSNRLDLMNARAQLVDAWRSVTVAANSLQGVFNISYNLDSATPANGSNGLAFAGSRTRNQVILDIEPPFVRRVERNNYRAAIISYQRSRRNVMAFEDNILIDSRTDLRNLRQLAESYILQQRAVELAYAQVDMARSTFVAPTDPSSARGAAGEAAALTQQLLSAQNSLLAAQNSLYTIWITYLNIRMELYLDLELLQLDERGLWNDESLPTEQQPVPEPQRDGAPPIGVERLPEPRRPGDNK